MFPELAQVSMLAIYANNKKRLKKIVVNVFSTKVKQSTKGTALFCGHREPHECLAACTTKIVPSYLSYFKTLST